MYPSIEVSIWLSWAFYSEATMTNPTLWPQVVNYAFGFLLCLYIPVAVTESLHSHGVPYVCISIKFWKFFVIMRKNPRFCSNLHLLQNIHIVSLQNSLFKFSNEVFSTNSVFILINKRCWLKFLKILKFSSKKLYFQRWKYGRMFSDWDEKWIIREVKISYFVTHSQRLGTSSNSTFPAQF